MLAGIGFTMSLFIATLAFGQPLLQHAKTGILAASLVAGVAGAIMVRAAGGTGQTAE
jgi:NhaA family Na+:H+ antiporter